MTPIPGEPLDQDPDEFTTADGRKVRLRIPGLEARPKPAATQERGAEEPPREDPRPPINPNHIGP